MTQFKRVISRFLHNNPKLRKHFRLHGVVPPTTNDVVTSRVSNSLHKCGYTDTESAEQNVVQPSTDSVIEEVESSEEEGEGEPSNHGILAKVEEVEKYEDGRPSDEYDDDEEDEDIPEVFPYDLVRKTRHEKIIQYLYVALTDNDREIAALRTLDREKFTHIVRVVFDPVSHHNITPSSWAVEETNPNDGPAELRLTFPALMLNSDSKLTALKEKQLLAARNYIAHALPQRNDAWAEQGHRFPLSLDECEDTRLLIVGPPDRSVDVIIILVCYMAFLLGRDANQFLGAFQRNRAYHSHWRSDILGKDSLDMANEVSKQKW